MAARDILFIVVILFSFGVGFFAIHYMMNTTVDTMLGTTAINTSNATVTALETVKTTADRMDYILFGLFIGLVLSIIVTSWFIGGHPIFMFAYFVIATIAIILATIFANVWDDISNMVIFGTTLVHFPLTNHILVNLPLYIGIIAFIGMVTMFAKPYVAGEQ